MSDAKVREAARLLLEYAAETVDSFAADNATLSEKMAVDMAVDVAKRIAWDACARSTDDLRAAAARLAEEGKDDAV